MGQISTNIDDIYLTMAKNLLKAPQVGNTRELNNVKLVLKDINNNIVSIRGISPSYLFGELLWYFNGDNSLEFISKFSSFWKSISDDGKTCNSAYGYLIQKAHGFDQVKKVIEILKEDPFSRRAKININVPNPSVKETKDEPCTMSLHFMIRENNLYCTAVMRSNDIWLGFPYDVAFFTELQKYIASQLKVGYGWYTHFAVSLHVYNRDLDRLTEVIKKNPLPELYTSKRHRSIEFNRVKFFDNLELLFDVAKNIGKEAFMMELDNLGIYKEDKYGN